MSSTSSASAVIKKNKPNEPEYKKLDNRVKFSFTIGYILLLTTATITFIEAMRTKNENVRHVLNLETCISVVAGYFYSVFVDKIATSEEKMVSMDWSEISQLRYIDWAITTPLMLLALCLVLSTNIKKKICLPTMLTVIALNYVMLYSGYLGEMKTISIFLAEMIGFGAFFAMFGLIFKQYVMPSVNLANHTLFSMYFSIWSLYGVAYLLEEEYKNIMMNYLDLTAKCLIGLSLWVYYTRILSL
jgi:bacteriorhodopsin